MIVGVLGGGQLGRMLALAGYPLGLRFRFLDPSPESPAGQFADLHVARYDDQAALARFADGLDVVTYEFENVPVATTRFLAGRVPVLPPPAALEVAQDRLREKTLFARLGIPTATYVPVDSLDQLADAVARIGLPAVLKTRRLGYDGKGQLVLHTPADVEGAWTALGGIPLILEGFVPFERELSILAARDPAGAVACYPLVANQHRAGILRLSLAPAEAVTSELQARAEGHARAVLEALDYVGVLAVELFQVGDSLLANEMAPRVHNSGHWTIEGAETSQFEQHLRAILGLPLGSTQLRGWSAMANLLGVEPPLGALLAQPGLHPHRYGKAPRPGRKLGHVTLVRESPALRDASLAELLSLLPPD
ncbi:MAG: 5-(carboxyamino)imidazole ribonucleotide synthase [Chloroflexi bacterium]|nr:5-(carboxyamino)imidazole ribonucleotide synthase [Chloroflexota bacterium]